MPRTALALAFAAALPAAALAQQPMAQQPAAGRTSINPAGAAVSAVRASWQQMSGYFTQAAQELSEADYAYRPVATVRTIGQLVGHVAGAQRMMCAAALGEPVSAEDAVEKAATTKAALVKALQESNDYCARAYAQTDAAAAGETQLFGQTISRFRALAQNAAHDAEHYGNVVTYMRLRGMVPPSSRR
jgi:uncharacterized damage-inducible protein DinB